MMDEVPGCTCVLCREREQEAATNRELSRRLRTLAHLPPVVTYVQHVSRTGEQYKVWRDGDGVWGTENGLTLPKSEFFLCEPPEVWTDVTVSCSMEDGVLAHRPGGEKDAVPLFVSDIHNRIQLRDGYRFTLVPGPGATVDQPHRWAFVIERKA